MSDEKSSNLILEGIDAARSGNRTLAYKLLREATELDPDGELGWLWLAGVSESPQEAAGYLERVLAINPQNEHAISGLKWAQAKIKDTCDGREQEASDWQCPLCLSSFPEQHDQCPNCMAVLSFSDLDRILNNDSAKAEEVGKAIERHAGAAETDEDFDAHTTLAIAYLNLHRYDDAISHLQLALRIRPDDQALEAHLRDLVHRLTPVEPAKREKERPGSILVVDDSPTICKLVEITLEKEGYQVTAASDGLDGLGKISEHLPDLILLDIAMARMDGYQFCKTIKSTQETDHIPVIMLSGKDGFLDKVKGRMAGASGYLTKPFDPQELVASVEELMNHKSG